MLRHNSTIRIKEKACLSCGRVGPIFSRGRCQQCAKIESFNARQEKEAENELGDLIKIADAAFSKYIRLSGQDENKIIRCFTCGKEMDYHEAQCGHFIGRSNLYLRWDTRNAKNQCNSCNCWKHGNISVYRQRLEAISPGLPDILYEESHIVFRPSKQELKALIIDFEQRIKQLK